MPKKLATAIAFVALVGTLYLGALRGAASVRWGHYSALQLVTHTYESPGGRFWSLERFREAPRRGHVDVVIFGSSHAYRGFDPRIFEAEGLTATNLGSTSQSPLNSRYLAERYLPELRPELVVVEVYYGTLISDGLESTRDLLLNTETSWPMVKMAWATWDLRAIGYASAKLLGFALDEASAQQAPQPGETYVPGGYVEATTRRARLAPGPALDVELRPEQLRQLIALTKLARTYGANVVWVTHPLPADHRERLEARGEIHARITEAAAAAGVAYWDFSYELVLDPLEDFYDFHHLNASGVARFDAAFLRRVTEAGLVHKRSK